jgi:hypothetical protein
MCSEQPTHTHTHTHINLDPTSFNVSNASWIQPPIHRSIARLTGLLVGLWVGWLVLQIRSSKFTYTLGFLACFLVVLVVAVMLSILSHSPVVFLRLAELQESEIDLTLVPDTSTGFNAINYTYVEQLMIERKLDLYQYSSPRFRIGGGHSRWYSPWRCKSKQGELLDPYDPYWPYLGVDHQRVGTNVPFNRSSVVYSDESHAIYEQDEFDSELECYGIAGSCIEQHCAKPIEQATYLIDFEREERMQLGRDFPLHRPLYGQFHAHESMAQSLNITVGEVVLVRMNADYLYPGEWNRIVEVHTHTHTLSLSRSAWLCLFARCLKLVIARHFFNRNKAGNIQLEISIDGATCSFHCN